MSEGRPILRLLAWLPIALSSWSLRETSCEPAAHSLPAASWACALCRDPEARFVAEHGAVGVIGNQPDGVSTARAAQALARYEPVLERADAEDLNDAPPVVGGRIALPTGPGLGVEPL